MYVIAPGVNVFKTNETSADASEQDIYAADISSPNTPRLLEGQPPAAANAAVALTQLHDWPSDFVSDTIGMEMPTSYPYSRDDLQDAYSDVDVKRESGSYELPSLREQFQNEAMPYPSNRPRELLPSILGHSPPGRYSSLPPIQRGGKLHRPRKSSLSQNARKGKHERGKSKEFSAKEFSRRMSIEGRKAMSAEPPTAAWMQGKRWEDLIEAATSATEADEDRDLTPVSQMAFFVAYPFTPLFTCCCQEIEIL